MKEAPAQAGGGGMSEPAFLPPNLTCSVGVLFAQFKYCRQGRKVCLLPTRGTQRICYSLWTICSFFRMKVPVRTTFKSWLFSQSSLCWLKRTSCSIASLGKAQKSQLAWLILIELCLFLILCNQAGFNLFVHLKYTYQFKQKWKRAFNGARVCFHVGCSVPSRLMLQQRLV